MCCYKKYVEIDGFKVVINADERPYDPEETSIFIAENFPDAKEEELDQLYKDHKQYAQLLSDEISATHEECLITKERLINLQGKELLLIDNSIIDDLRDEEYWIKKGGRWVTDRILNLGIYPPQGAIYTDELSEELYKSQREEIADQNEKDRIASLSDGQREKELEAALDALADEADRLERRAQIRDKDFDAAAWYREGEAKLNEKYGIKEPVN
jgi:hypothetical protein